MFVSLFMNLKDSFSTEKLLLRCPHWLSRVLSKNGPVCLRVLCPFGAAWLQALPSSSSSVSLLCMIPNVVSVWFHFSTNKIKLQEKTGWNSWKNQDFCAMHMNNAKIRRLFIHVVYLQGGENFAIMHGVEQRGLTQKRVEPHFLSYFCEVYYYSLHFWVKANLSYVFSKARKRLSLLLPK